MVQVVTGVPGDDDDDGSSSGSGGGGEVRVVLAVADGRASLTLDPSGAHAGTSTIILGYADALAMARGELDPADALAAGRVRVRGDLAALVAGQDVLVAAAEQIGPGLEGLTDPAGTADA